MQAQCLAWVTLLYLLLGATLRVMPTSKAHEIIPILLSCFFPSVKSFNLDSVQFSLADAGQYSPTVDLGMHHISLQMTLPGQAGDEIKDIAFGELGFSSFCADKHCTATSKSHLTKATPFFDVFFVNFRSNIWCGICAKTSWATLLNTWRNAC